MSNFNYKKELLYLDSLIIFTLIILFIKFFIYYPIYPLHDEIIVIERFTKWWSFLWRNGVDNHTINSFFSVIIKSIFGYNFLFYRFISFFFFSLILVIFRKLYPNIIAYCIFIIIILSSQLLTNYIFIFRGYYSFAFLTVLNFFFLKKFIANKCDNKNFKILLLINLVLICHSIFTLYIAIPVLIFLIFTLYKKFTLDKVKLFFIFFIIPLFLFYFFIIILEGFTIIYGDNLNINFFLKNFFRITLDGFVPGFKKIFFNSHYNNYRPEGPFFFNFYNSLINSSDSMVLKQITILIIYLISHFILVYKIYIKKFNYLDFILIIILLFFYIIHFIPEPRVHVGICFFYIFYIFENLFDYLKKNFFKNKFIIFFIFILFIVLINIKSDENFYQTKFTIDKINSLRNNHSCKEFNKELTDYEIWIVKNYYSNLCNSYYDFKNQKNVLY
jgi:hypothetical protein